MTAERNPITLTRTRERAVTFTRVRWRYPHWRRTASARTRFFSRPNDAAAFAERMRGRGALVETAEASGAVTFGPLSVETLHERFTMLVELQRQAPGPLSYRQMKAALAKQGVSVSISSIGRAIERNRERWAQVVAEVASKPTRVVPPPSWMAPRDAPGGKR